MKVPPKKKNAFEKLKFTQCVLPKIMALVQGVSCRNYFLSASLHRSKHVSTDSKLTKLANITAQPRTTPLMLTFRDVMSTSIYTVTPCETAHNTTCGVTGSWFHGQIHCCRVFQGTMFPTCWLLSTSQTTNISQFSNSHQNNQYEWIKLRIFYFGLNCPLNHAIKIAWLMISNAQICSW